jgi:hypothetical protein
LTGDGATVNNSGDTANSYEAEVENNDDQLDGRVKLSDQGKA